jgi:hypothetical protein
MRLSELNVASWAYVVWRVLSSVSEPFFSSVWACLSPLELSLLSLGRSFHFSAQYGPAELSTGLSELACACSSSMYGLLSGELNTAGLPRTCLSSAPASACGSFELVPPCLSSGLSTGPLLGAEHGLV